VVQIELASMKHADRIQALVSHPEVLATTRLPDPYPKNGAIKWIQGLGNTSGTSTEVAYVIFNAAEDLVGTCGFIHPAREMGVAEIGCWIGRAYWNRGYATEALRLVLRRLFEEGRVSAVAARTLKNNRASCRVLEKLGFAVRGEEPNHDPRRSRREVIRHWELRREDWLSPSG
jgi:RimJ/RimL family protein N-acetyltransferase